MTSDKRRERFVLYEKTKDGFQKLGTSTDPLKLEKDFSIIDRLVDTKSKK